ncbi:IS110-like element ISNgo3 family transposase [Neisseria meningitidis]|uniref:IS110-like element ISNgo3 family transposase n=2 Tax=Neisseria meningitidis TaxID=487 RepID=UPI000680C1BB|nr:IS110-like element ISNgo3 family transposase [Neisseria meningitidis]MBG9017157.1 IS110-like element ISNgo3 family transposase [Neisseria meningitidis]MBG9027241.1 IS110-like element ISNgo3 family transposase [Neisseria meningitidis]MCF6418036.1 IS110-like element ISNgo3 family transposase [Neisseria meningitidis]CWO43456.1 invertase related gene 7%2C phage associated protein [Neisseria meningitidis]CWO86065.1 invertase related gene 7%2C phage associated protein [Neisseria meningitidis]
MNIIGLDISKDTIDATLHKTNGSIHYIKFKNNDDGLKQFRLWIKGNRIRKAYIGMEATGIYYEKAADMLSSYYTVYVINPLKIKDYGKSRFNRTKTDKADSNLIADYIKRHQDTLIPYQIPKNKALQKLINLKNQLQQQQKQIKNRLHSTEEDFIRNIHQDLIDTIQDKMEQVKIAISEQIKKQTDNNHYRNLQTIPSIGKDTASVLYAQLTEKHFKTANQFVSYAGLSPAIIQSGTSVRGRGRLSRYGNRRLKSTLYMPALCAYRFNAFPKLINNLKKAGKPKMVIIVAIMRKLAKLAYYIVKTGQPYDAERHRLNQ